MSDACVHIRQGGGQGLMCKDCADEAVQSLADKLASAERREALILKEIRGAMVRLDPGSAQRQVLVELVSRIEEGP